MEWLPTGSWTLKGNTAYLCCTRWPGKAMAIGGLRAKVERATLLASGQVLTCEQSDNRLVLKGLPATQPDSVAGATLIKLECSAPPKQVLGVEYVVLEYLVCRARPSRRTCPLAEEP